MTSRIGRAGELRPVHFRFVDLNYNPKFPPGPPARVAEDLETFEFRHRHDPLQTFYYIKRPVNKTETKTSIPRGPERLTILERVIVATRLPYSLGCLVLALVCGGPGFFLIFYLGGLGQSDAWTRAVSVASFSVSPISQQVPVAQGVVDVVLYTLTLFASMLLVRYLRLKVLSAESKLSSLSPSGETTYHRAFGLIGSWKGPLFLALVFSILYVPSRASGAGPISLLGTVILIPVDTLIFGLAIWVYVSGIWGLYRFGHERLNLKPFYEDPMLGLHPLGQIAVSFAATFSSVVTVALAGGLLSGSIANIALTLGILAFGLAMLFLPLEDIHRKMVRVKEEEEVSLRSRRKGVLINSKSLGPESQQALSNIEELLRLQALESEVSRIPAWPFETRTVERLVAIILTVFTVILARLLQLVF